MEKVGDRRQGWRQHEQNAAQQERAPQPGVPRHVVDEEARARAAHVEGMPELREGQRQERNRHRLPRVEGEPACGGERRECTGGQRRAVQRDHQPLHAPEEGLLGIARRSLEDVGLAVAHRQRKGREHVGHEIEIEDLQRQQRQWQRRSHRDPDHHHLAQVARQEIGDEPANVAENDAAFANRLDDGREGIVEQDHRRGLPRDVGAAQAHRHADVGLPQRRRVVDAVAGHRDDVAGSLVGFDKREFLRRAYAGEDGDPAQSGGARPDDLGGQLAVNDPAGVFKQPDGTADAARGHRVIAGHHHDADSGAVALVDGVRHVGPRRVLETDQTDQKEAFVGRAVGLRVRLHRTGEHTQAVVAEVVGAREPFGTRVAVELHVAVVGDDAGCGSDHRFRRPLDRDEEAVATLVHRRHHLAVGVESMFADSSVSGQQRRPLQVRPQAGAQERDLHRIAAAAVLCAIQMRVVAEHRDAQQESGLAVIGEVELPGALARGRLDLDFTRRRAQATHGHPVLGQGSGLVGQDDRRGAQRLDRGQALDQRVLPGHAPHAACERERRHDREALRNRRDGKRDRGLNHQERILAAGEPDGRDRRRHKQCRPDELTRQTRQPALEWRAPGIGLEHELRRVAELGREPDRHNDGGAAAACNRRALEQHGEAVAEARDERDGLDHLVHADRLAGQHRLVRRQMRCLDEAQVGRYGIAGIQEHDVAGHQVHGRNQAHMALAAHAGAVATESAQPFDRARGLQLRHEPDQRVDREHDNDRAAFLQLAEIERQRRRGTQEIDDRARELVRQQAQNARGRREAIVFCPNRFRRALGGLAQPFGSDLQLPQDFCSSQSMGHSGKVTWGDRRRSPALRLRAHHQQAATRILKGPDSSMVNEGRLGCPRRRVVKSRATSPSSHGGHTLHHDQVGTESSRLRDHKLCGTRFGSDGPGTTHNAVETEIAARQAHADPRPLSDIDRNHVRFEPGCEGPSSAKPAASARRCTAS